MSKDLHIALLLDFYGDMLTDKQKNVIGLYYEEDLSLGEIAEVSQITRQGVRDSIKRGEQQLYEYEEKLGLAKKFLQYRDLVEEIEENAEKIRDISKKYGYSIDITRSADEIIECIGKSKEIF